MLKLVYTELHRQAHRYLLKERVGHTLQTTALVHEAYLKLVQQQSVAWESRSHFFAIAATMMRRILIDYAKTKHRVRRGGVHSDLPLENALTISVSETDFDLLALDEAKRQRCWAFPNQSSNATGEWQRPGCTKDKRTYATTGEETQPRETSRHPAWASSAEYAGYLIRRHRLGAVETLGMLALAMTIAMFWYFKHTRAAPVLTEKDTILLADFDNKTGDEVFDGTLKQGLALQLGQSPFLSIFPESSVRQTLRLMNRSPDERVIGEVAHEMCERQGLKAFIACSIAPLGSHYVLTLEVVKGQGGEVLVREQTEAESKEQVLKALSQAASSLREKLGESLSSIKKLNAPLQQATTSSLEALKSYSLGVDWINKRGTFLESIPFLKRAVELDPTFASAYARLSLASYNSGQLALAVGYAQKAFEMRERVSGRERFFIESRYYSDSTGDANKAIETYEL